MIYEWDKEEIIREYLKDPGYGARYRIEKQGKYSWKTIDKVLSVYFQELEKAKKEPTPKSKGFIGGGFAFIILFAVIALSAIYAFLSREKQDPEEKPEKEEPESPISPGFEGRSIDEL